MEGTSHHSNTVFLHSQANVPHKPAPLTKTGHTYLLNAMTDFSVISVTCDDTQAQFFWSVFNKPSGCRFPSLHVQVSSARLAIMHIYLLCDLSYMNTFLTRSQPEALCLGPPS